MNRLQTSKATRLLAAAFLATMGLLVGPIGCSGGGSGSGTATFKLTFVDPAQSLDLNGGDVVIVHGSNFNAAGVVNVLFNGSPGFNRSVLDDGQIQVTIPPSPSGQAGRVNVEVVTLEFGTKGIFAGFEYVGPGAPVLPPSPQTIVPTVYTPTGAEQFRIAGTNLGVDGTRVTVRFEGIGTVLAVVSAGGTFAVGNAPVSSTVPPGSLLKVTIENSVGAADLPTMVSYSYTSPSFLPAPFQEGADGASRPVRITDGLAIMATSGTDASWGNGNDELFLIQGPPNAVGISSLLGAEPAINRNLDIANSIPVVLDSDTVIIFTHGLTTAQGDETLLLITNLTTTPVITAIAATWATRAPLARISSTRVAYIRGGQGAFGQDELVALDIVSGVHTASYGPIAVGTADRNSVRGRTNKSIPFSPDGDSIFVWSSGGNLAYGDGNDVLYRYKVSTAETAQSLAPFMVVPPVAVSASRVVGASGPLSNPPDPFDSLQVFNISGNAFSRVLTPLNSLVDAANITPIRLFGNGHVALLVGGPDRVANTADDQVAIFVDDGGGGLTRLDLNAGKRPTMTAAADGTLIVFSRGVNNVLGDSDDRTIAVDADTLQMANFIAGPPWQHGFASLTDSSRAFAIGSGPDQSWNTGDEVLFVYQSIAAGLGADGATLPLAPDPFTPLGNSLPFVPVGFGWGLIQSPGLNLGFLSIDDRILIAYY